MYNSDTVVAYEPEILGRLGGNKIGAMQITVSGANDQLRREAREQDGR